MENVESGGEMVYDVVLPNPNGVTGTRYGNLSLVIMHTRR